MSIVADEDIYRSIRGRFRLAVMGKGPHQRSIAAETDGLLHIRPRLPGRRGGLYSGKHLRCYLCCHLQRLSGLLAAVGHSRRKQESSGSQEMMPCWHQSLHALHGSLTCLSPIFSYMRREAFQHVAGAHKSLERCSKSGCGLAHCDSDSSDHLHRGRHWACWESRPDPIITQVMRRNR